MSWSDPGEFVDDRPDAVDLRNDVTSTLAQSLVVEGLDARKAVRGVGDLPERPDPEGRRRLCALRPTHPRVPDAVRRPGVDDEDLEAVLAEMEPGVVHLRGGCGAVEQECGVRRSE